MIRSIKNKWSLLVVSAGALLCFCLGSSEAIAQAAEPSEAELLRMLEQICTKKPNHEVCVKPRKKCMGVLYEMMDESNKQVCRSLGWTRAQATGRAVRKFKEHCDGNDSDEECNILRKSCREEALTCEVAQKIVCREEGDLSCDRQYLCTESRLRSMCSGKTEAGAQHMLIHANYTSIEDTPVDAEEFQSAIYSISSLTHGQTSDEKISTNYVVDMGLGWIKGSDNNGLAYELQALIGGGLRHNEKFMVGAAIGGGFSGIISGDLGFGWLVSTEVFAAMELVGGIDVLGFVRPTWVFSEDPRGDGSETFGFADELKLGGTVTWTKKRDEGRFVHGRGYGLSLFMQEQLGVRMFGVGIGIASTDASKKE